VSTSPTPKPIAKASVNPKRYFFIIPAILIEAGTQMLTEFRGTVKPGAPLPDRARRCRPQIDVIDPLRLL
jgi:hypothetical protein